MKKLKKAIILFFFFALLSCLLIALPISNYQLLTSSYFIGEPKYMAFFLLNLGFIEIVVVILIIKEAVIDLLNALK